MRKTVSLLLCVVVLFGLCACGATSRSAVVEQMEEESGKPLSTQATTVQEKIVYPVNMQLVSDDGLIHFSVHDDNSAPIPSTMPVLRVRPQIITSDMARQMVKAVFGDAELFEFSEELSKSEVAEMIAVWENAVTDDKIRADHGADAPQNWIDSVREGRLEILEFYRNAYAYARDEVTPVPCQWKFWPMEHYAIHGHDYAGRDASYTDKIPAGISVDMRAVTKVDGIPYELWVNNNERADFRNHSLSIFVLEPNELFAGGQSYDETEAHRQNWNKSIGAYSYAPATNDELASAGKRAEQLAYNMGLGKWIFDASVVDMASISGGGCWQIELDGQPIYEGFPVSWQNPSDSPDFYPEAMTIHMKNDGTVIDLKYSSPLEIVETVEQSAQLKQWDEMSQIVSQTMQSLSCDTVIPNYVSEKSLLDAVGAQVSETKVDIDSVSVGYTRVPHNSTDFLLIPTVSFTGNLEVLGSIPGVHESTMNLLFGRENGYRISLAWDLRDGALV